MKYNPFNTVSEIANALMIAILSFAVSYFTAITAFSETNILYHLNIVLVVGFSYILRKKSRRVVGYLVFETLFTVLDIFFIALFTDSAGIRIILIFYVCLFLLLNILYLANHRTNILAAIPVYFVLVFVALFISSYVLEIENQDIFYYLGVAYFAIYFVRIFFLNSYILGKNNITDESMPYYEMIGNDSKLAFPALILITLTMILVRFKFLEELFLKAFIWLMENVIVHIIDYLLYIFNIVVDWFLSLLTFNDINSIVINNDFTDEYLASGEESLISAVLSYLIMVIVVVFLAYVLYRFVVQIINSFSIKKKKIENGITDEEDVFEFREKIVKKQNIKRSKVFGVRKEYRDTIDKIAAKGYEVKMNHTPAERSDDVLKERNKDILSITIQYEKERYGHEK